MMELVNSYDLSEMAQGVLFALAAIVSMGYHYIDHWIESGTRLLNTPENIWKAYKTLGGLLVGSTVWAYTYDLTNIEILFAGCAIGLTAFSKGMSSFERGVK